MAHTLIWTAIKFRPSSCLGYNLRSENLKTMKYNIKLDAFEGPLDLLLHLIKENQVDVYDIPIATITEQYFEYIDLMKDLNLDVAGEYLVMAATLTYIKSKTLLPPVEDDFPDEDEGLDPRDELVAKLVEYKKYKEASINLRERELTQSQVFVRELGKDDTPEGADLLLDISVFELLKSFRTVLDRLGDAKEYTVTLEEISVTDKLNEIVARLEDADSIVFDSLFENDKNKIDVIATFLALLELLRLKLARAHQTRMGGEILIYRTQNESKDEINNNEEEGGDTAENIIDGA